MLACAAAAQAEIPASLKADCQTRTPQPGYTFEFCTDGYTATFGRTPNIGGVRGVRVPAKYDGYEGLPAKAADADHGAGLRRRRLRDARRRHLTSHDARAAGRISADRVHARLLRGRQDRLAATGLRRRRDVALQQRLVRVARLCGAQLHGARVPQPGRRPAARPGETQLDSRRFEINDFQHLAGQIADDPFFNVNPQKVVSDRRLLRRRIRLDGAHRPEVGEPRRART